jgi:8-oxo-dGTP pyrophosphatase MutT (NUDIX family)
VLLVRRNPAQRFMGGFWVFPGGVLDPADGDGDGAHRAAAVRELREEAGVAVDAAELVGYSRWITPELIAMRFDTQFFLARAPARARPRPDGVECVEARWSTPRAALEARAAGELALLFPTVRHLEELAPFASVDALMAHARSRAVSTVLPRVVVRGERTDVYLPGEAGYTEI